MQTVVLGQTQIVEPGTDVGIGFVSLGDCIEAVESYNSQVRGLIASSLRAGEAIHNIFEGKRWEEMELTGFEALCKKMKWTRSNCYELKRGWEMYLEFNECIPPGVRVAGAYAWAQLYKVHKNRRRVVLAKAIAFAEEENGEVTGPTILKMDKPEIGAGELKILSTVEDLTLRQETEELAIENAKRQGRTQVNARDCHEAIEQISKRRDNSEALADCLEDDSLSEGTPKRQNRKGKSTSTGKNYDEMLETAQLLIAVNQELKEELQQLREEMKHAASSYQEQIALMKEQLVRLEEENQQLKASYSNAESAS